MKAVAVGFAVVCLLGSGGCSAFRASSENVTINTSVPDADVYVNNQLVGRSPVITPVRRNCDAMIVARKAGYVPAAHTIGNHFNLTGVLDTVGCLCYLVPGIGLLTSGAWSLDETNVMLQMIPDMDMYRGGRGVDTPAQPPPVQPPPAQPIQPQGAAPQGGLPWEGAAGR